MKNLFWLLIIAFGIVSCNNSSDTIISGKIINNENFIKELTIKNHEGFSQVIKIKNDNTFLDTLKGIESGYYRLYKKNIYLIKGDNLVVQIDLKNRDKPIALLKGKSVVVANNYLYIIIIEHCFKNYMSNKNERDDIVQKIKSKGIQGMQKEFALKLLNMVYELNLRNKKLDKTVSHIRSLTTDKDVLKQVDEFINKSKNLAQGQPSPTFSCEDINGKTVSLSDLKEKLVYIDIWATWCGPCIGEIPYIKKLEKEYHRKKVYFVSMSVDNIKDKVKWNNMVKDKKLGGIQLFNKDNWQSEFVKSYEIKGIPHFILLDKKGNIISADAPRPSSPEIRLLLDEWLKKY